MSLCFHIRLYLLLYFMHYNVRIKVLNNGQRCFKEINQKEKYVLLTYSTAVIMSINNHDVS